MEVLTAARRDAADVVTPPHGFTLVEVAYPREDELALRARETRARRPALGGPARLTGFPRRWTCDGAGSFPRTAAAVTGFRDLGEGVVRGRGERETRRRRRRGQGEHGAGGGEGTRAVRASGLRRTAVETGNSHGEVLPWGSCRADHPWAAHCRPVSPQPGPRRAQSATG